MVRTGLDILGNGIPEGLRGRRVGLLCHAASIDAGYRHAVDVFGSSDECTLGALFGPQHGLYGQTQANMIEWEGGAVHPRLQVPLYSLYGATRKPDKEMLQHVDCLVVDLQDVGARPYTYVWTLKLCMEACAEAGLPLWVLDRPNPIGAVGFDGPMLDEDYFTFVGGARIPLCHRMTVAEIATLLRQNYYPHAELHCVWMQGWWRDSLWGDTGLPWVLPSPNIPTPDTAVVYPGMVLLEATNVSEGRGTTRPFELFGAPFVNPAAVAPLPERSGVAGWLLREHGYIPTFDKWRGEYCQGMQIHVTDPRRYRPVAATAAILQAIKADRPDALTFNEPPYEYETQKLPFDILSGDTTLREQVQRRDPITEIVAAWEESYAPFREIFDSISHYPEQQP